MVRKFVASLIKAAECGEPLKLYGRGMDDEELRLVLAAFEAFARRTGETADRDLVLAENPRLTAASVLCVTEMLCRFLPADAPAARLTRLDLSGVAAEEGPQGETWQPLGRFLAAPACTMQHLVLAETRLGPAAAAVLAEAVEANASLASLDLSGNPRLMDDAASALRLSTALCAHGWLIEVRMYDTGAPQEGIEEAPYRRAIERFVEHADVDAIVAFMAMPLAALAEYEIDAALKQAMTVCALLAGKRAFPERENEYVKLARSFMEDLAARHAPDHPVDAVLRHVAALEE